MSGPDTIEDYSEAEIGALRWRAMEVANSAEGLTGVARRVLGQLICAMNGKTRDCYPSEAWLAGFLGVDIRSVKKAKTELRDKHNLIRWENPKGPRHKSYYDFNWQKIKRLSAEAKARAGEKVEEERNKGAEERKTKVAKRALQGTMGEADSELSKVPSGVRQGAQIEPQGALQDPPKVPCKPPDQPTINLSRTTQLNTPSAVVAAPDGRAPTAGEPHQPDAPRPVAAIGALEEDRATSVLSYPFPKVLEAFGETDPLRPVVLSMDADGARMVSKLLATKGKDAAADYVARAVA